jgi:hypothetical protein
MQDILMLAIAAAFGLTSWLLILLSDVLMGDQP